MGRRKAYLLQSRMHSSRLSSKIQRLQKETTRTLKQIKNPKLFFGKSVEMSSYHNWIMLWCSMLSSGFHVLLQNQILLKICETTPLLEQELPCNIYLDLLFCHVFQEWVVQADIGKDLGKPNLKSDLICSYNLEVGFCTKV